MTSIRRIDDHISVAPQIRPEEMSDIAAAGFVAIVNNRPDGEEPGQPSGAEIAAAAAAAGLAYTAIPVTHAGAGGPVLAYCRSGTRSCNLWALAAAKAGRDADGITASGAGAGYDLSGIRPLLDQLSAGA
jgi:protein tyrosine phosphatase (PTP) superfamily phosphohydrolase (DUF442 family)